MISLYILRRIGKTEYDDAETVVVAADNEDKARQYVEDYWSYPAGPGVFTCAPLGYAVNGTPHGIVCAHVLYG